MQIFQWLFKVIPEQAEESTPYHTNKKITYGKDVEAKHIILYEKRGVYRRRSKRSVKESDHHHHHDHHLGGNKYLKPFAFLRRKDVARTCFCNTLNLKRLGSINRRRWVHSMNKMKKDQEIARGLASTHQHHHHHKAHDSATAHAGSKVLPISDAATNNKQCGTDTVLVENKKDYNNKLVNKGDHKTKTMSRMKELLRWAAAAKSAEKGSRFLGRKLLHQNRATSKAVADDEDQPSMESPKISFIWDVESNCSTTSSVYPRIQMASSINSIDQMMITSSSCNLLSVVSLTPTHCIPRKGNWITTDSEFVVLEL